MPKYCTRCGRQNEDQSAFCVACGAALLNVEQSPSYGSPVGGASAQRPLVTFTAVTERGRENAARDISLKDDKGDVVFVAKRKPLHQGLEICDPQGVTKGKVNHKMHFTHSSFEVCDQYGNVLTVIGSGVHQKWSPPNCWLEDAEGNRQGKFEFARSGVFALVKSDGTTVFEARLTGLAGGEGFVQRLMALATRGYTIDVFDSSFSALMLMGAIAVIETQWV